MKRSLSLLLVLLMLIPLFTLVACDKKEDDKKTPNDNQTNNTVENSDNKTTNYIRSEYSSYDYDGYNFRILSIDQGEHYYRLVDENSGNEVWYDEDASESHQHAVFTRNLLAEEILGINISAVWGGNTVEVPVLAETLIKAGGDDFDIVLASLNKLLQLGINNRLYNLYDVSTFDMGADWWDQELVSTYTYKKNRLYTISGDYTIFDDYAVPVIYYNKNALENYNLGDPADLVDAGTWTIEELMSLASKATHDITGDGSLTVDDAWGYVDNDHVLTHLLEGCKTFVTALDADGVPQVICDSEDFVNTVQFLFDNIALSTAVGSFDNEDCTAMMMEDRALFYYELLGSINSFREMESVFSLLPLPKKDLNQDRYSSVVNTVWATSISIPITNRHLDQTGIILNVLGGLSTDTVNKSLHEVILGPKLFREKRTVKMLQYALDAKSYEWAKEMSWANSFYKILIDQYNSKSFTLASSLQKEVKVLKKMLKIFLAENN